MIHKGAPAHLKSFDHWVGWRYGLKDGRPTKLPMNANSGRCAESDDPRTWTDYQTALRRARYFGWDGLGFMFGDDDPFTGVDLDHCRDKLTGTIESWAETIIRELDSYTELSPSMEGVKIWVRAKLPPEAKKRKQLWGERRIEIYSRLRFFTVTGIILNGS